MVKVSSVNRDCTFAKPAADFFDIPVPNQWWKGNETGICMNIAFGRITCIRSALAITKSGDFETLGECSMINVESKL